MTQPFKFSNGQSANNVEDLIEICEQSPTDAIDHLNREDFEKWLDYIGDSSSAQKAKQARLASVSDEERLQQFLTSCKLAKSTSAQVNGNVQTTTNTKTDSIEDSPSDNPVANFFKSIGKFFAGN